MQDNKFLTLPKYIETLDHLNAQDKQLFLDLANVLERNPDYYFKAPNELAGLYENTTTEQWVYFLSDSKIRGFLASRYVAFDDLELRSLKRKLNNDVAEGTLKSTDLQMFSTLLKQFQDNYKQEESAFNFVYEVYNYDNEEYVETEDEMGTKVLIGLMTGENFQGYFIDTKDGWVLNNSTGTIVDREGIDEIKEELQQKYLMSEIIEIKVG